MGLIKIKYIQIFEIEYFVKKHFIYNWIYLDWNKMIRM